MKTLLGILILGVLLPAIPAGAAFVAPTPRQIAQAAADPARIPAMIQGASVTEAAQVARAVIARILLDWKDAQARAVRVRAAILQVMAVRPREAVAMAVALGSLIASSPTISGDGATLSTIQASIIEAAGADRVAGADLAAAFGNAFALAMQSLGGAPGSGKTAPATPPPPPITVPYEGQSFE